MPDTGLKEVVRLLSRRSTRQVLISCRVEHHRITGILNHGRLVEFFAENERIWNDVSSLTLDDVRRRFSGMGSQSAWPANGVKEQPLVGEDPNEEGRTLSRCACIART